jgi:hybrid polyketide synthase/nonribosomal peptide synthetase FtdB
LARIWQHILQIEKPGIHDNFFELRGTSISLIRQAAEIHKEFGIEIPVLQLFKYPTIHLISMLLENRKVEGIEQDYMTFNPGRARCVFCYPPVIGYGLVYSDLAALLPEYTFYSFNFIESGDPLAAYAAYIERLQPQGDLVLLGYSSGGNLAYEVAGELEKRNRSVIGLIILDAQKEGPQEANTVKTVNPSTDTFTLFLQDLEVQLERHHPGQPKEEIIKKAKANHDYWRGIVHQGRVDAACHLLRAERDLDKGALCEADNGWGAMVEEISIHPASGRHVDLLTSPHLEENAKIIAGILEFICKVKG